MISGLAFHWDASLVAEDVGQPCALLDESVVGAEFVPVPGGEPTVRLDESGNKYLEFDGDNDVMVAGAVATFKFLHDGVAPFTVAILCRIRDENRDALEPLLDTCNDDAGDIGFGLYYDNRTGVPAVRRLRARVAEDTGVPVLNLVSADNQARPQEWQLILLTFDPTVPANEENFRLFADGQLVIEADKAGTPSAANPTRVLTLGALAAQGTFAKIDVAEILIWNARALSSYEIRKLGEYCRRKWNSGHVSLVAGNDVANAFNDATPTRGYPAGCFDAQGVMNIGYRRGVDDGASVGVGVIVRSSDGIAFSEERVVVTDAEDNHFAGPQIRMTTPQFANRLVAVWAKGSSAAVVGPGRMRCTFSDDHGATWATPIAVNPNDIGDVGGFDEYCYGFSALVELPDGTLLTFYNAKKTGVAQNAIVMMRSTDGGANWSGNGSGKSLQIHHNAGYDSLYPSVVRYPSDGVIDVFFRENTGKRCMRLRSTDGGLTFGAAVEMFTVANSYHGVLVDPSQSERLYNFYRNNSTNRAVYRYSDNRGTSWSTERPIDNRSDYSQSAWTFPFRDAAGNIWITYGMGGAADFDSFCRIFRQNR